LHFCECTDILRARCQHSSARQVAPWSIPPPAAPLHGSSLQVIKVCPPAGRETQVLGRLRRQGPAQCRRAWSECIMRWGHARGRTTAGRVPSHRRLSASGLRAGGEASRLRFGKLWPWRSRYWGSASCSLRFSLRIRWLPCHSRELLHRTEAVVAVWEDAFESRHHTQTKGASTRGRQATWHRGSSDGAATGDGAA
jgi:hypothetical protein